MKKEMRILLLFHILYKNQGNLKSLLIKKGKRKKKENSKKGMKSLSYKIKEKSQKILKSLRKSRTTKKKPHFSLLSF